VLTKELVEKAVPPSLKGAVTQSLVDKINTCVQDPIIAEQVQENFVHYTSVLKDGKFKTEDYLHAVMYVSFKLMGQSNHEAYMRTFPQRYQTLLANGTQSKDIAAYVSAYNKGKLVNLILEQAMVPTWVLNQHMFQEALAQQYHLMTNAVSEKVQTEAANSLLTHLKRPEAVKAQVDINVNDSSGMTELKEAMRRMAEQQRDLIQSGVEARQIAAQPIHNAVDADFEVVSGASDDAS
jgi:hypothetical protein